MIQEYLIKALVVIMIVIAPFLFYDATMVELERFGLTENTFVRLVGLGIGLFASFLIYHGAVRLGYFKGDK